MAQQLWSKACLQGARMATCHEQKLAAFMPRLLQGRNGSYAGALPMPVLMFIGRGIEAELHGLLVPVSINEGACHEGVSLEPGRSSMTSHAFIGFCLTAT